MSVRNFYLLIWLKLLKIPPKTVSKYKTNDRQVNKAARIIVRDINKRYGKLLKKLAQE